MSLKEIARSAGQSIRDATCEADGQATLNLIETYIDEQTHSGNESNASHSDNPAIDKLSSELFGLFGQTDRTLQEAAIVSSSPEARKAHQQHYLILRFVHHLLPLLRPQRIFQDWWEPVLKPILTTASYTDQIKQEARKIVSDCLIEEQHECRSNPLAEPKYSRLIVDQYLAWVKRHHQREETTLDLLQDPIHDETGRLRLQHQALLDIEQDEWSKNLKVIVLALGAAETKQFFMLLNEYFLSSKHRLQIVYLLSEFMLRKRTHLHEILETPLFNSMLLSLMYDNSTTLIAISVTNMIMLLPRICTSLPPFLPQLFYIFARALCWDQLRDMRKNQMAHAHPNEEQPATTRSIPQDWDCIDYTFSKLSAPPSNPQTGPFFTSLYGLYPCNFLHFLHKPYAYFKANNFKLPEEFDEEAFRTRTMLQVARHMLHPNVVTMDSETELTDKSRWMKMEPPDVIAQIMSLDLTNAASRVAFTAGNERKRHQQQQDRGANETLWEQIGQAEQLSMEVDLQKGREVSIVEDVTSIEQKHGQEEKEQISLTCEPTLEEKAEKVSMQKKPMISNIIQVHRALKSGAEVLVGDDVWDAGLERLSSPPPSGISTPKLDTASSIVESTETFLHAPGLSETRNMVAALKREVLLLRNELNFELFLKQQHLQHIGRLHREHVLDNSVEAERQQLYNTTRMLKAHLKQTTDALEKLKLESAMTKQKHIKWEDEQSGKLRSYREMRKDWQHKMDAAQRQIVEYDRLLSEQKTQLDEARQQKFELENELNTIQPELEKVTEYEHRVQQLTKQMLLWEKDTAELEKQKQYSNKLSSQWWTMEELVSSLQSENCALAEYQNQRDMEIERLDQQVQAYQKKLKQTTLLPNSMLRDTTYKKEVDELYTAMRALQHRVETLEMERLEWEAQKEVLNHVYINPPTMTRTAETEIL